MTDRPSRRLTPRNLSARLRRIFGPQPGGPVPTSHTGIQWTDATWNPMTGCTRISAGCDNCYALTLAHTKLRENYARMLPVHPAGDADDPFAPRFWEDRLDQPLRWRQPRRIFVNSMSDIFHAHFPLEMIRRVFDVMNRASHHQFQVLTKRPERALRLSAELRWTDNIWMGTTVEDASVAPRLDALRRIPAAVRFVSAEPLLGPLDGIDLSGIHWVIGGGESGEGFREVEPAWARGLRDLCTQQGVSFFWKQWGGKRAKSGGRLLDGREWNEYPVALPVAV
jgi:protein gp37